MFRNLLTRIALPLRSAPVVVQIRGVATEEAKKPGFIGRMADKFQQKRSQNFFGEHMEWLQNQTKFTLNEFQAQLTQVEKASNPGGIGKVFTSVTDHPLLHEIKAFKGVMAQMTPEEMENPNKIDRVAKKRISEAAKSEPAVVNEILRRFYLASELHKFLVQRKAEGKPLPKDQAELELAIRSGVKKKTLTSNR